MFIIFLKNVKMKTITLLLNILLISCAQQRPQEKIIISEVVEASDLHYFPNASLEVLAPKITILNKTEDKVLFKIQGNIASNGLSINKIKNIRTAEEIVNNQLNVKVIVEVVYISGKEGSGMKSYNYEQQREIEIPKNIQSLKIDLIQDRLSSKTTLSPTEKTKQLATERVDLNKTSRQ